jgi:hypothetical protein
VSFYGSNLGSGKLSNFTQFWINLIEPNLFNIQIDLKKLNGKPQHSTAFNYFLRVESIHRALVSEWKVEDVRKWIQNTIPSYPKFDLPKIFEDHKIRGRNLVNLTNEIYEMILASQFLVFVMIF